MADLSSGNDEKSDSKTGGFKLFGKSPSRSFSKKSSNPLKKIFASKKSDKQNLVEAEIDESISNGYETTTIEEEAPNNVVKKIEKVPKFIEEKASNILHDAKEVVPKLIQEVLHKPKKIDTFAELKEVIPESQESIPVAANEEKKVETLLEKLNQEKESINEESKEKAKENHHEEVLNKVISEPIPISSSDQPLDDKEPLERSVNIDHEKGNDQDNEKREDNCVASLAKGLQQICVPWSKNDN